MRTGATVVRPIAAALPELAAERWAAFAGEDEATRRANRAILLAHAESLANRWAIASSWDGERLRGIAIGLVEVHPRDRAVLVVTIPGAHQRDHAPGLWVTVGEQPLEVAGELLGAMASHAREEGISRLVVAGCPSGDEVVRAAVEGLGGRPFAAPPEHQIGIAPGTGFAGYLAGLGKRRSVGLRRDLRRPEETGVAVCEVEASDGTLEAIWPLVGGTFSRKASRLRFSRNLLIELARRLPAEAIGVTTATREGDLLGALVVLRAEKTSQFNYIGHIEGAPLHVVSVLAATAVRAEIERGAARLLLGPTNDVLKRRLGAVEAARINWVIPVAGRE